MNFLHLFFIFTLIHYIRSYSDFDNYEIRMISDFVNSNEKATAVVAHTCWTPFKKVQLITLLMSARNLKSVSFVKQNWAKMEPKLKEQLLVIVDVNCPDVKNFLEMAYFSKMFAFPYRWLIIGKPISENGAVTPEVYNLPMLPDSDVVIAQRSENNSFVLSMVFKMSIQSKWQTEYYGVWVMNRGLKKSIIMESSISTRRKNFGRMPIKTALVILDNKTISNPYDLSDILADTVSKSSFRQTDPLYGYLNATRHLIYSETWGYYRNGSHGGMVAELTIGDAELAGTVLIATQDRMEVVEFLSCPTPISIRFVFREPPLSYQNNLFLLPFKTNVWYCIGAFVLVLTLILYVNALWETRKLDQTTLNASDPTSLKPNISDIAILMISAISQQGSSTELKGTLGRIVMFILFLAFLLLYSSYSASIVALLQSSSNQIRTLSDLLNSKLELGVEDTPYNRYFFAIATEPVRKAIYQTKIAPRGITPKFMSLEQGVKKLQNEPFAFHMNIGIGYRLVERYFHEHEKCGLQEISYLYATKTYITCRKNSPYKEIFKIGLFRIQEHGLSDRETRLIYARKPACRARGGSFGSVNMVDFHPVLMMYLYGIILAFMFLFIEILVHKKRICERVLPNTIVV